MIRYKDLNTDKKAFIFELDNVLYPEKDYLLQVYYLFANLLEYTETVPPASDLIDFMKKSYEHHGKEGLFERAAAMFGIDHKYLDNFKRIHVNAQLPLKLLLFEEVKNLLREIVEDKKRVFVLTKGNPLMQLNKLKQIDWGSLGAYIKIYFYDELVVQGKADPLTFLINDNQVLKQDALFIGHENEADEEIVQSKVDYISIEALLNIRSG